MPDAARPVVNPFAPVDRPHTEPDPTRAALRVAGPISRSTAPTDGPVWIVTTEALAKEVCSHPDIAKDPAFAPPYWDPAEAGLERTAAEQPSLTTLDGPAHAELRRAHAPLFSAKRIRAQSDRIHQIARELLTEAAARGPVVDLMAGFTTRYPLTVLLDLLGIPLDLVDEATDACLMMVNGVRGDQGKAIGALAELAAEGLRADSHGLAAELRDRLPAGTAEAELRYHLFALIFAGQLTTDSAVGFLIARALGEAAPHQDTVHDLVDETLRQHAPAPFSLWRFTTTEVELAGVRLPARTPLLVDILGINTDPARTSGTDLTFGSGAHFCIGAQLAREELRAVVTVLRTDFPAARLAMPATEIRQVGPGGIMGSRLAMLPVALRG
ncbi:cytochrome P450 family protein [Actinoalloteichus hymeniacidonis]|uniref:Cytochrome P450 n=1 Tax=Actinoalloteichus hymeniacidonis TaxID=340345 RepID=A0AAC9HMQ0_9PSEU|nr:cytochrome P450 [Actinoalloteichus hymeniacidonis]AOS62021.1 cytochrome P450 [Actinoalloteichus hymeniacidonis]MBB5909957.1 cytochrome P450 [Actinoalloteichus hymeniacidonis]